MSKSDTAIGTISRFGTTHSTPSMISMTLILPQPLLSTSSVTIHTAHCHTFHNLVGIKSSLLWLSMSSIRVSISPLIPLIVCLHRRQGVWQVQWDTRLPLSLVTMLPICWCARTRIHQKTWVLRAPTFYHRRHIYPSKKEWRRRAPDGRGFDLYTMK